MVRVKVEDKRNAILRATLLLVNSNGFHAAPMSLIAKNAGVSAGTIYLYFENKEDLINTLYRELKRKFSCKIFSGYSVEMPVKKGFEVVWRNVLQYRLMEPDEAVFIEQCDSTPMISEETKELGLGYIQPLFDLWDRGIEEGIIKPISRPLLFAYSLYPIYYITKGHIANRFTLSEECINSAFKSSWDAIRT
jgi:AcrR family transcriptional regulator